MVSLRFKRGKGKKKSRLLTLRPLPTMVTIGNLLCGFAAIVLAMRAHNPPPGWTPADCMKTSGLLIFAAMVFDAFDGQVARWTNQSSRFGMEMDSLCDVVSFGVAPAVIVKAAIDMVELHTGYFMPDRYVWLLLVTYVVCAALRLGRYNVETSDDHKDFFYGIPSPAAAGCVASWIVMIAPMFRADPTAPLPGGEYQPVIEFISQPENGHWVVAALPFYMLVIGILMVSRVHYIHAGDKILGGKKTFLHFGVLALLLVILIMQHEVMLAVAFNGYLLLGMLNEVRYRLFPKQRPAGWFEDEEAEIEKSRRESEAEADAQADRSGRASSGARRGTTDEARPATPSIEAAGERDTDGSGDAT